MGGWGRDPFSRNFMKPTPRRKWYLTTGRSFHEMELDPIPQSLPVHFFGSRPQPPTSPSPFPLCLQTREETIHRCFLSFCKQEKEKSIALFPLLHKCVARFSLLRPREETIDRTFLTFCKREKGHFIALLHKCIARFSLLRTVPLCWQTREKPRDDCSSLYIHVCIYTYIYIYVYMYIYI